MTLSDTPRILIVEDEPAMQIGLRDNLEFEGYAVDIAGDGDEGLRLLTESSYDLALLDVMLPKRSGFDVCKAARGLGIETPIIMLTAKGQELDKVLGLELGADDYVTKPFSLRELLARIKAVLRRQPDQAPSTQADFAQIGELAVDFRAHVATRDGDEVPLTHLELEVLRYLVARAHAVVSRDELLSEVWGYQDQPTTRTVDNFVLKLRQKLEAEPSRPRHLLTVHGIGYKLIP